MINTISGVERIMKWGKGLKYKLNQVLDGFRVYIYQGEKFVMGWWGGG